MLHPFVCALFLVGLSAAWGSELTILAVTGRTLENNPLGDPTIRRVAIIAPDRAAPDRSLPLVVYLPGWGGSPDEVISGGPRSIPALVVQRMADAGLPLRFAVVDGRSRYGGSQFLNSTATGNYADYVVADVISTVEKKYPTAEGRRLISGHSSGGYGALMLAMNRKDVFHGVVALSPDSDFETTHKPIVQESTVRAVKPADLDAAMAPAGKWHPASDQTAQLVMGLCANYTPTRDQPGRFDWLYNERGEWREDVWQRWIAFDPLTAVKRDSKAFTASYPVYLDGAQFDEFGANIGARHIYDVLKTRSQTVSFYEAPGHHSDHLPERLERGLRWVLSSLGPSKPSK